MTMKQATITPAQRYEIVERASRDHGFLPGNTLPPYTGGDDAARFTIAEQHRAGLKFTGAPRDTLVRITRYKNGRIVEIIEKRVSDERVKVRKGKRSIQNWPSKTMKTRAKIAKAKRMKRDTALLDIADATAEDLIALAGGDA